jgi:di/tricarboxylate transporter
MELPMIITICVIVAAVVLFSIDLFPVDHVAIAAMVVLALTGVLTPTEAVQGFANSATITVAAMFVLSDVILKTGFIDALAPAVTRIFRRGPKTVVLGMSAVVGSVSAFINNTPVVATFIPLITGTTRRLGINPSKFLIPLSYAAIFGGTCTLIGTSTNLLVSGIAEDSGLEPFSMFQMAPMGLVFFGVGTLYMVFIGQRLTPEKKESDELSEQERIQNFLTEVRVVEQPDEEKDTIKVLFGEDALDVEVTRVKRKGKVVAEPAEDFALQKDDVLLIRGNMKNIKRILENDVFEVSGSRDSHEFPEEETLLIEIVILPNSELGYKQLRELDFLQKYNATVLAIRQRGTQRFKDLKGITLKPGDILLLQTNEQGYKMLQSAENQYQSPFLSMREMGLKKPKIREMVIVGAVITAVITLASLGILSIMIAAIAGIVLLGFLRIVKMTEVYRAIDWQVIFLLAGALSLGAAMEKSGISQMLGGWLIDTVGASWGPIAVVSALYLCTLVLTEVMSNNASVALMAPVAISISTGLDLSPLPFLLAVTFAGSASFMTPIGYQTNTMVYSAGNYAFTDFTKVGAPLALMFWLLATWLIPHFYPF